MYMEGAGFDTTSSKAFGDCRRHVHSQADGLGKALRSCHLGLLNLALLIYFLSASNVVFLGSKIDPEGSHVVPQQFVWLIPLKCVHFSEYAMSAMCVDWRVTLFIEATPTNSKVGNLGKLALVFFNRSGTGKVL